MGHTQIIQDEKNNENNEQYKIPTLTLTRDVSPHLWGDSSDEEIARRTGKLMMGYDRDKILKYVTDAEGILYKVVQQRWTALEISREKVIPKSEREKLIDKFNVTLA